MKFSTYMNISIYLMALTGLLAIALVEEVSILFVLFASLMTITSLIFKIYKPDVKIVPHLLNILSVVLLALFFADYLVITQSLIGAAARFITALAIIKLFDLNNRTDYMLLSMLVFFQLLSASASTVSPLFFAVLSLFTICAIWTMVLFNIEQDWKQHYDKSTPKKSPPPLPPGMFNSTFFTGTVIVTFISIAITLSLFFIIPRMGIGLMHRDNMNTIKVSGFADEVDLGEIGSVKLDNTIVMRIEIDELNKKKIKKHPFYLRGKTFKTYKDDKWIKDSRDKVYTKKTDGRFDITKRDRGAIEHKILLEPLSTPVIFAISYPQSFEGKFRSLWRSESNTVQLSRAPYNKIQYTAWSNPSSTPKGAEDVGEYLAVPQGFEKIKNLTIEVVGKEKNTLNKIAVLEGFLKKEYSYTLDPKTGGGQTPLHDFLFYTKEGYCEQFSTALTIMLRTIGIPARLATGFFEGEWNEYGSYYIVRQRDAHSWVEAFIEPEKEDNRGRWITVDPTPPVPSTLPATTTTFNLYLDSLQMKWIRYVINFTSDDQMTMATNMESQARNLKTALEDLLKSKPKNSDVIFLGVAVLFILLAAILFLIKKRKNKPHLKTPLFYLQMLSLLDRRGLKRKESETPLEFAKRCHMEKVDELTEFYINIRFGHRSEDKGLNNEANNLLKELKKETQGKPAS